MSFEVREALVKETHTPGPWVIEPHDPTARGHWLHDENGAFVCLAVKRDEGGPAMELANARLIAAAPDLLDALKRMLPENNAQDRYKPSFETCEAARDTIAKAEGTAR